MNPESRAALKAFLIELVVYGVLVVAYFFLVLHLLGGWLHELQGRHLTTYALISIGLIVGQAVVLENVTTWLMRFLRGRSE